MKKLFSNWGAVIIIGLLFIGSWIGQWFSQWVEYVGNAEQHGQEAQLSEFMPEFLAATFENWQSEFLQLAVQAILIASFVGRRIFNADDGADKEDVERILNAIERRNGEE